MLKLVISKTESHPPQRRIFVMRGNRDRQIRIYPRTVVHPVPLLRTPESPTLKNVLGAFLNEL